MTIAIAAARATALGDQTDNPFLAWDNLAVGETLSGTATLTDGEPEKAVTPATHYLWLPDIPATTAEFTVQFASPRTISFVGLAAHNLGTLGASARVRRSSDGVSWTDAGAGVITPTDDGAICWRMVTSGQDYAYWQVYFTGLSASAPLAVGVALFGDDLVVPQRFYAGFAPALTPTEVALQSNVSQGGNVLGSSVVTRGSRLEWEISHLTPAFLRGADWLAFQTAFNEGLPAFFGWRPELYPGDLHYVWRDGPVLRPVNMGIRAYMSVPFSVRAYEP